MTLENHEQRIAQLEASVEALRKGDLSIATAAAARFADLEGALLQMLKNDQTPSIDIDVDAVGFRFAR